MDESLQELENELKRLTPRRPSRELLSSLERELGDPASAVAPAPVRELPPAASARVWRWAPWAAAGLAAALAFVSVTLLRSPLAQPAASPTPEFVSAPVPSPVASSPALAADRYQPVHASTVLYDMNEEPSSASAADASRQVRYRYVDTYTWKNPRTNASLRWSVPRDEVRLVRASLD